jgi:hypothetical protein
VRTAVPAREYAALAVAERSGFVRHSEAVVWQCEIPAGPIDVPYEAPVEPARAAESGAVLNVLAAAPELAGWQGLIPLGWRFRWLVPELVRGLIKDSRVLRAGEAVEGVACLAQRGQTVVISALAGPPAHRQALFGAVAERARNAGARDIALFAADLRSPEGIRAAFFPHPWCPDGLIIVEKRVA